MTEVFLGFPQSIQANAGQLYGNISLNYATTASFHILSISSFSYQPFIRRYTVSRRKGVFK
jgi:hypothetical protein